MILKTYSELNSAAKKGYGSNWSDFYEQSPNNTVLALQKNLFRFSGAKTYAMQLEIQSKMYDGEKLRPWNEFEKDVLKINSAYNRNYLQAEWQTARQAAHHARNWEQFQQNKDLFPNLKYKTAGDSRVRPEHAKLNGVVKPIDDPFWDKYYPPNGWRCRCTVTQTAQPAMEENIEDDDVKPEFKINVGKTRQVFREKSEKDHKPHTYFALWNKAKDDELKKAFELAKLDAPLHTAYQSKSGGYVKVSPFKDDADFFGNYRAGIKLAEDGHQVEIRPHLENVTTNPEYRINGIISDRKAIDGLNNISGVIDDAKKQMFDKPLFNPKPSKYSIVFDFIKIKDVDWVAFKTQLNRKITKERGKYIQSIFIIYKNRVIELSRDEIVNRDYEKLNKIQ